MQTLSTAKQSNADLVWKKAINFILNTKPLKISVLALLPYGNTHKQR